MAVDNTNKKKLYLIACYKNAEAFQAARLEATRLREMRASDAVLAALVDADCLLSADTSFLTITIVDNYLTGVSLDFEKALTNQAVATSNRLPNLLAIQSK